MFANSHKTYVTLTNRSQDHALELTMGSNKAF